MTDHASHDHPLLLIATIMRHRGATGVQTHINDYAEVAAESRHDLDVEVISAWDAGWWCPLLFLPRVLLRAIGCRDLAVRWYVRSHMMALATALRRRLARTSNRPVVIHAQEPQSVVAATRACARSSTTVDAIGLTVHFNESIADEWVEKGEISANGAAWRLLDSIQTEALRDVRFVIFVSQWMLDHLRTRHPELDDVPHTVIHNGVEIPAEAMLPTDDFEAIGDLIAIGTLERRKNQSYLLDILWQCHQRGHPFTLTLVGGGPDGPMLERRIRELGLSGAVTLAGPVAGAATMIPRFRALVHGAARENFSVTILEALAASRPVCAPAVGGAVEALDDAVDGRLWPISDPERAASMLIELLDPDRWLEACAAAGRKAQRFDRQTTYAAMAAFALSHAEVDHG